MKSVGLYSGKWTPKSDSVLGDPSGKGGSWCVSKEWIRKVEPKSTPLSNSSETLGGICFLSGSNRILLKGSNDSKSSDYKVEEEEEDGCCLLLELAFLRSFSGSDRGLTKSDSKWDLMCLKGSSLG